MALVDRDPLRRFEDIPDNYKSTSIHSVSGSVSYAESIFEIIEDIKSRNESISQGDIAVLFLDKGNYIYDVIHELSGIISSKLGWKVNISFETKTSDSSKFFISNINNAKGLEFPFVICFAKNLNRNASFRNGLYTMMARSFLESHLVIGDPSDHALLGKLNEGLNYLNTNNCMNLRIPPPEEIENQADLIIWDESPSIEEYVRQFCEEKKATPRLMAKLISRMTAIIGNEDFDDEYINSVLELEYQRNFKL